LASDNDISATD